MLNFYCFLKKLLALNNTLTFLLFLAGSLILCPASKGLARAVRQTPENLESNGTSKTFSPFTLEELEMYGVVLPPRNAYIQDCYRGIRFLATPRARFSEMDLKILKLFIDRSPIVFLRPGPAAIINWQDGEIQLPFGMPKHFIAIASGPYIFFDAHSLAVRGNMAMDSVENNYRAFIHELIHVLQFQEVVKSVNEPDAISLFRDHGEQTLWNLAALDTDLVKSFVGVTGWRVKNLGGCERISLEDKRTEKTTAYGKKGVLEDVAETISFIVIGDTSDLSKSRVKWALKILGYKDERAALMYTFPYSSMFKQVRLLSPGITKFDSRHIIDFKKRYWLVDLEHFVSEKAYSFPKIVSFLKREFSRRGWLKEFSHQRILKHGIRKQIMKYRGKWRDVYLEAITYDYSKDYLLKPAGTVITVLSGYKDGKGLGKPLTHSRIAETGPSTLKALSPISNTSPLPLKRISPQTRLTSPLE